MAVSSPHSPEKTRLVFLLRTTKRLVPCAVFLLLLAACAPRLQTAAWIVRYDLASPAGAESICLEAREAGLDAVLVQVRGRGDAYYRSELAPPAESLAEQPPGFDPLGASLAACAPLPVHAWLNVYYLWGGKGLPSHPLHPAQPESGWLLEDADGRSVADYDGLDRALGWIEGIYADPADPDYRKLFTGIAAEVAGRYPVAGIHLDFIRYPGPAYGQGGPLGAHFQNLWGLDPRWLPLPGEDEVRDWLAGVQPMPDRVLTTAALLWAETRAAQVTALVRAVKAALSDTRRPVLLSAAVFPDPGPAYLDKGQDWRTWAAEGLVDELYPMAYFGGPERVGGQLAAVKAAEGRAGLWAGLGAYIKEPERIGKEAAQARRLDYRGICLFDLGSLTRKPEGSKPYVTAAAGRRPLLALPPEEKTISPAIPPPASGGPALLGLIAQKSLGGNLPALSGLESALAARWAEFTAARPLFAEVLTQLAAGPQPVPAWLEMRGVFRYLDPLDGSAKRQEQLEKAILARERLRAGEDFGAVAKELSQGGSKNLGGMLKRRWLTESMDDRFLAVLAPGELSLITPAANGFWCYEVLAKGGPEHLPLAEIPWPVRRQLFRSHLARVLEDQEL